MFAPLAAPLWCVWAVVEDLVVIDALLTLPTSPQMSADLDGLTSQLVSVVQAEIQRSGSTAGEADHRQVDNKET